MKILVRAPNWIGDAVLAVPAIRSLAASFPQAKITLVASPAVVDLLRGMLEGVQDLRAAPRRGLRGRLIEMPLLAGRLAREKYDLGIAFPASFSSALLLWLAGVRRRIGYAIEGRGWLLSDAVSVEETAGAHLAEQYLYLAEKAGAKPHFFRRLLRVPLADLRAGDRVLREAGLDPRASYLAVAPGAVYGPAKRWPAARFGDLCREITSRYDWPVVVLGSAAERKAGAVVSTRGEERVVDLTGRTTVRELAAILRRARLLVSNDSGAMHLAAAVGTHVVALFGSTDPAWTGPLGTGHRVVYHDVSCAPCLRRTCVPGVGYSCLTSITVPEVLAQVQQALFILYQKTPREPAVLPRPMIRARLREEKRREGPPPFEVIGG
jgi:heptosyltransferase-2